MNSQRAKKYLKAALLVGLLSFRPAFAQEEPTTADTDPAPQSDAVVNNEGSVRAQQFELSAERLLAGKQAGKALEELAQIAPGQRSPKFLQLMNTALMELLNVKTLSNPKALPFSSAHVRHLIVDPSIAGLVKEHRLTEIFADIARKAASAQDLGLLSLYYDLVISLRQDPNTENDELRFDIARSAESPDVLEFARGRIDELHHSGALSYLDRLQLLLSGFYGRTTLMAFSFLSVLTLGLIFIFLKRVQRMRQPEDIKTTIRAHRGPAYAQPTQADDEYSELLRSFGLPDHASEDEIKSAYRRVIKAVHPDTSSIRTRDSLGEGDLARQFMELKSKYERILEIRKGWFNRS